MYLESYKDLLVWQKSIILVKVLYTATEKLPLEERFGLTSQIRRAAISIPSNIAEGYKRKTTPEYIRFLNIADGSAAELETQLILVKDLYKNMDVAQGETLLTEVQKMLITIIKKLNAKIPLTNYSNR